MSIQNLCLKTPSLLTNFCATNRQTQASNSANLPVPPPSLPSTNLISSLPYSQSPAVRYAAPAHIAKHSKTIDLLMRKFERGKNKNSLAEAHDSLLEAIQENPTMVSCFFYNKDLADRMIAILDNDKLSRETGASTELAKHLLQYRGQENAPLTTYFRQKVIEAVLDLSEADTEESHENGTQVIEILPSLNPREQALLASYFAERINNDEGFNFLEDSDIQNLHGSTWNTLLQDKQFQNTFSGWIERPYDYADSLETLVNILLRKDVSDALKAEMMPQVLNRTFYCLGELEREREQEAPGREASLANVLVRGIKSEFIDEAFQYFINETVADSNEILDMADVEEDEEAFLVEGINDEAVETYLQSDAICDKLSLVFDKLSQASIEDEDARQQALATYLLLTFQYVQLDPAHLNSAVSSMLTSLSDELCESLFSEIITQYDCFHYLNASELPYTEDPFTYNSLDPVSIQLNRYLQLIRASSNIYSMQDIASLSQEHLNGRPSHMRFLACIFETLPSRPEDSTDADIRAQAIQDLECIESDAFLDEVIASMDSSHPLYSGMYERYQNALSRLRAFVSDPATS
ncbi:MAG: hypothetical protein IPJ69_11680 [Deltaproteobacteria bacterium]|nr:MAG: hypothetical protein IPJ69_11680 [Deltaproteobacteria bacterium]